MSSAYAILIAGFDYSTIAEDEFHAWYDTEHIPERMGVKGFINAQRWIGVDDPRFALATYDLENLRVLDDPAYTIRKAEGRTPWSRRIASKTRLLVRMVGEQLLPGRRAAPEGAGGPQPRRGHLDLADGRVQREAGSGRGFSRMVR